MRVVCDTSPLILLAKIDRIGLLAELYDEILVPSAVLKEVEVKSGRETTRISRLVQHRTFQLQEASTETVETLPSDLGSGERAAIALAVETEAALVILDERQGRRVARGIGLSVTGTIGVLIEAQQRNEIPSLRHELDRLIEAGMWIDEVFYHRLLQEFED